MPAFTKGKWECWKHEKYPYWYVGREGSERFIATVDKEANARLIAAAPEMYKILSDISKQLYEGEVASNTKESIYEILTRIDN